MTKRVMIRCDGGTDIGMGHVVRCMALGHMLKAHFDVRFVLRQTEEAVYDWINREGFKSYTIDRLDNIQNDIKLFINLLVPGDIVVLDGYQFESEYQNDLIQSGFIVVAIDDLHKWHQHADIVINHADQIHAYACAQYTQLLTGLKYALLRPEFLQPNKKARAIDKICTAMISMGAADIGNLTYRFAQALIEYSSIEHIKLLVSDVNPHIAGIHELAAEYADRIELLSGLSAADISKNLGEADLMICPSSSIALESCARGILLITGYTAENQQGILHGLSNHGACVNLGNLNTCSDQELITAVQRLDSSENSRSNLLIAQHRLIDGKSPQRILDHFMSLKERETTLWWRKTREEDLILYFDWTNDPDVRANSFSTEPISLETHSNWFHRTLNNPDQHLLLFFKNRTPVGQIRLSVSTEEALVNYSIAREHRGKGYAKEMLIQAEEYLVRNMQNVNKITGKVKPENTASSKAFKSCGYDAQITGAQETVFYKKVR